MSGFGERLRALRTGQGLTQAELAQQLGVSKSALCMYERGEREPRRETLLAIAAYFHTDLSDLFGLPRTAHLDRMPAPPDAASSLSPDERLLLELYRALDSPARADLLREALEKGNRQKKTAADD